ncbi:pyridoxal-phosphate dependent enzyme [Streptomyces sp. NRRL S-31]|uniref:pyridoxal-phosphate dependent enzyme n=1 Tax=Streptomyces sp. NRRL S-31 TaxID=1463898 RepID=UPI00069B3082|nr:pyridoxal-phosphate dependent enzyme [Streptomyces sp. NRRL S-31]
MTNRTDPTDAAIDADTGDRADDVPPPRITRALERRAPAGARLTSLSFAEVEARAHAVLPELAALRPTIGDTPLVPVPSRHGRGTVWLKMESGNDTGTVKARTAYALLCGAVAGHGSRSLRCVEYSSGSLAFALAEFCAVLGLDLHLVVPHTSPDSLCVALRRLGAGVSKAPEGTGFLGAMEEAARVAETDDRHLLLQHCAAEAVAMHRELTGAETVRQLRAARVEPAAVAASVGTGGTVLGMTLALRTVWPECAAFAVFPAEGPYADPLPPTGTPRMKGTGGLGHGLRQPLLAPHEAALGFREVAHPDALEGMRVLRSEHGIAVSASGAGAWLVASQALDDAAAPGGAAVAVVASRGTKEEWADAGAGR